MEKNLLGKGGDKEAKKKRKDAHRHPPSAPLIPLPIIPSSEFP